MKEIFEFLDYRTFLDDFLEYKQKQLPYFSLRYVSSKLGVTPSFFVKILKGTRNISNEHALKLAEILKFSKPQNEYFQLLVQYNQAKGHEEKKIHLEKIISRRHLSIGELSKDQYKFYSQWYYPVIRELMSCISFVDQYDKLAKLLLPPISPSNAKQAITFLEQMGMIAKNADGYYKVTQQFVLAGPEIQTMMIRTFQLEMMDRAKDALLNISKELREISTMTVSLSETGFAKIKDKIQDFWQEVKQIANEDSVDRVYHINLQFFPVTSDLKESGYENV
jgi:uncharacterized protein (TIGR02147 family)